MCCIILIDDISLRSSSSIIFCLSPVAASLSFTFLKERLIMRCFLRYLHRCIDLIQRTLHEKNSEADVTSSFFEGFHLTLRLQTHVQC